MRCGVIVAIGVLFLPSSAFAQQSPARPGNESAVKVWVDLNFLSLRTGQGEQTHSATFLVFPAAVVAATTTTTYPAFPSAFGVGVDAGLMLRRELGVGFHFDSASYSGSVGLAATVPHPVVPNGFVGQATAFVETAETREKAFDVSVVYRLPAGEKWQLRVFGGPSYLKVARTLLSDYSYSQQFDFAGLTNVVQISQSSLRSTRVVASTWGFHVGADVAYFFNRHVGLGGVIRMNRGKVSLAEPLTGTSTDVRLGHVAVGGGLRLRF